MGSVLVPDVKWSHSHQWDLWVVLGERSFLLTWGEEAEDGVKAARGRAEVQQGIWDSGYSALVLQPCRAAASEGFQSSAVLEAPPAWMQSHQLLRIFSLLFGQLTLSPFYFSGKSTSSRPPNSQLTSHPFLWCILHFHLVGLADLRGIFQP